MAILIHFMCTVLSGVTTLTWTTIKHCSYKLVKTMLGGSYSATKCWPNSSILTIPLDFGQAIFFSLIPDIHLSLESDKHIWELSFTPEHCEFSGFKGDEKGSQTSPEHHLSLEV